MPLVYKKLSMFAGLIVQCFACFLSQVEAELNYATDMFDLNRQVNSQENIVGWWATGHEVTSHSSLIHDYYTRECANPVHLTLDTTLKGDHMGIKAYLRYTHIKF